MLQSDTRSAPTTAVIQAKKPKTLIEPVLSDIAKKVLGARYLMKNETGEIIETPRQLFERVARYVASAAESYGEDPNTWWPQYYNLMAARDFEPNTPCLVNAGRPGGLGQLSACFVIPIEDTMPGIFDALKTMAQIQMSGGGCVGGESIVLTDQGPVTMKDLVESQKDCRVLTHGSSQAALKAVSDYHTTTLPAGRIYNIEFDSSASIRASDWHPFFVWRGDHIEETRADALKAGDTVIGSSHWKNPLAALNERAWLAGFLASDGAFDNSVNGLRLRICKGYEGPIKLAAKILDVNYGLSKDPRYQSDVWELGTVGPKAIAVREQFGSALFDVYHKRLPSWIWSADIDAHLSMLVGLFDGDGWFGSDKTAFTYDTVSEQLAVEVEALAGMVGLRTRRRIRPANPEKNEKAMYEITFVRSPRLVTLMNAHSTRHRPTWGHTQGAVPLDRKYVSQLAKAGFPIKSTAAWRKGIEIDGHYVSTQRWRLEGITTREVGALILDACGEHELAAAVHSARIVKSVEQSPDGGTLYDLTVPGPQNYIAGVGGFVVAHNTGFSFSRLRPANDFVRSTSGIASGPVSFMTMFNQATEVVKQGGVRRGANMAVLRVDHPDILAFIACKQDVSKFTNFNISVAATDVFMAAVTAGTKYDLINPNGGKIVGQLDARAVFNAIVTGAWRTGDPGLLFIDRVNQLDPTAHIEGFEIESSNPCQPGWATVLTPQGIRTFDDIEVGDLIWSGKHWTMITNKVATGVKTVAAYRTRAGTFYGTVNHRIVVDGEKVEVGVAHAIDTTQGPTENSLKPDSRQAVIDGLVLGDGMTHKASGDLIVLLIGKDDHDYFESEVLEFIGKHRPGIKDTAWHVTTTIETLPKTYNRTVPKRFQHADRRTVCSFLRGLYSANGSIVANRVTLKASSFAVIEAVQQMLSSLGIVSYYTTNKTHDTEFDNGIYTCRESYDLNIGTLVCRRIFRDIIGFLQHDKNSRLKAICRDALPQASNSGKKTYEIVEIEKLGEEPVFDITVEADEHTYWTGGLLVSNCGELPLAPDNACTLGSINISNFVVKDDLDWDRLAVVAGLATRFLDDVLTVNKYPVPAIHEATTATRKIGLGIMGWADALIKLGIPYGSETSLALASRLMATITTAAVEASEKLATVRGPFPLFAQSKWAQQDQAPRRNATVTAIAPTGTISIIANCSGGCEPIYALCQVRNQADMQMIDFSPLFEKIAEREGFWSVTVRDHVMETGSVQDCAEVPARWREVFKTANEIEVAKHVKMQAALQQHVHDAISKTINLQQTASIEEVEQAYLLAWDTGCKGITVYRDNCRPMQILSAGTKMAEEKQTPDLHPIPTVPYDMKAAGISTPSGKLSVKLGIDSGRPFEIWLDSSRGGTAVNADTEAIGRLATLVLRLNSSVSPARRIQLIANQLADIGGGDAVGLGPKRVKSLPDGLSKTLRVLLTALETDQGPNTLTLIVPPTVPVSGNSGKSATADSNGAFTCSADICPECHQVSLVPSEGCATCHLCGFSKC